MIIYFRRARKEFAHNGKIVPNIGVVCSAAAYYNDIDCLFTNASGYSKEFSGMLLALCDLGESVSVLNEQRLEEYGLENYKTLVVTKVSAIGEAEVLATEKNGKKYIHVVNLTGEHRNPKTMSFETIPALYGVNAELAADKKPKSVKLQPEGREIPFVYEDGRVKIALDKVEIYTIIEVE